jgi:hypothetical protein
MRILESSNCNVKSFEALSLQSLSHVTSRQGFMIYVVKSEYALIFFFLFQRVNISKLYHSLEIWAHGMSGAGAPTFCEELALRERKVMEDKN